MKKLFSISFYLFALAQSLPATSLAQEEIMREIAEAENGQIISGDSMPNTYKMIMGVYKELQGNCGMFLSKEINFSVGKNFGVRLEGDDISSVVLGKEIATRLLNGKNLFGLKAIVAFKVLKAGFSKRLIDKYKQEDEEEVGASWGYSLGAFILTCNPLVCLIPCVSGLVHCTIDNICAPHEFCAEQDIGRLLPHVFEGIDNDENIDSIRDAFLQLYSDEARVGMMMGAIERGLSDESEIIFSFVE